MKQYTVEITDRALKGVEAADIKGLLIYDRVQSDSVPKGLYRFSAPMQGI